VGARVDGWRQGQGVTCIPGLVPRYYRPILLQEAAEQAVTSYGCRWPA
jgi:hypothetical protein